MMRHPGLRRAGRVALWALAAVGAWHLLDADMDMALVAIAAGAIGAMAAAKSGEDADNG